jgi:hypothetical protein
MLTSTDAGATLGCSLDAAAFSPCTSPADYIGLADGKHTFAAVATDVVNRIGKAAKVSWTVDTQPPETTITKHPVDPTSSTSASFRAASTESKSTYECRLDAAPFAACKSSKSFKSLLPGPHTYEAQAIDQAGNVDPSPASFAWTISS